MQTFEISADVQAQERDAIEGFLRTRLLLQGQTVENLTRALTAKDAEVKAFRDEAEQRISALREQISSLRQSGFLVPAQELETTREDAEGESQ